MATSLVIDLSSPAETSTFGRRLGQFLFAGSIVALEGPLGAGKTFLVKAIAEGLGLVNPAQVTSPTFVLIQEYNACLPIYHFDAYRLTDERQFAELGVHEYFTGVGVCLVEWADRVGGVMPVECLRIRIQVTGEESRRMDMKATGERYQQVLAKLRKQ